MSAGTTATTTATGGGAPTAPPRGGRFAVLSVMMGIFAIVTTEILPIGLLTSIGADFTVSDGTAGLMMTMPGFLAAVCAPTITVATARVDRRLMLCAFMLLLTAANVITAAAPAFWAVLVARVLVGVTIGGFWSIGAGLAERLVPRRSVARATAVIFSAVPLGSVLGVPAGTLIGDLAGWRVAFAAMALLSAGVLAALLVALPPLPSAGATRLGVLRAMLGTTGVRMGLLVTFLVVLAHFAAYTYVTPFLTEVTGAGPGAITLLLLAYGVAGFAGNLLGGAAAARWTRAAFGVSAAALAAATVLLPVLGAGPAGAAVLLMAWGLAYGAVPVCSQTWFAASAPHAPEAASILFTASFQATIGVGALAGGAVVDHASPSAVMLFGGCAAGLAAAAVAVAAHRAGRGGGAAADPGGAGAS
jgi:predicted MFS family arabinose efflux permease